MKNRNIPHSDNWATPKDLYVSLNNEFGFTFDPCPLNHDLTLWDGLERDWGEVNFINPPYSRRLKEAFIMKAIHEANKRKICVMLLPVSTSIIIFHEWILPNKKEIRFIKGRVKFLGINTRGKRVENKTGMHDSMIVVF